MRLTTINLLNGVNTSLDVISGKAQNDFTHARHLFLEGGGAPVYGTSVYEALQYADTLHQKISHIRQFHQDLLDGTRFSNCLRSLFMLSFMQLQTAKVDYLDAVDNIYNHLNDRLKGLHPTCRDIESFINAASVIEMLDEVGLCLYNLANNAHEDIALDELEIAVATTYSMESERFVFCWLVANRHHRTLDDFLDDYQQRDKTNNVELF